jgi:hypothetical protein
MGPLQISSKQQIQVTALNAEKVGQVNVGKVAFVKINATSYTGILVNQVLHATHFTAMQKNRR